MTTVQAFNTTLKSFLEELADVFPEETQIRMFLDGFDALTALNPRAPLDMFVESISPHVDLVTTKNPEFFARLQFPGGIDFNALWGRSSDNTREAIWQYINLLMLLGTTVRSMPAEMLQGIETVAQNCADQMQNGQFDFSALGNILMSGGLGSLANAAAGGEPSSSSSLAPTSKPRASRRAESRK